MGHIINPLSQRIGYSTFWNSNWSASNGTQNFLYSYTATEDINLNLYLKKLFLYASRRLFGKGLLFLGFKLLRFYDKITLIVDTKFKQLVHLYNAIELIFLNSFGLYSFRKTSSLLSRNRVDSFVINKKKLRARNNKLLINSLSYKIKPKFVRRTTKLTPYNSVITEPDFRSYNWANIVQSIYLRNLSKGLKNFKTSCFSVYKSTVLSIVNYILLLRWFIIIKKFISTSLYRFYRNCFQFDIIISLISNTALTATFIAKYLSTRLLQKFPLRRLINLIVRQLKVACDSGYIHGFKIACNGRFERRGRATHIWKLLGKLPRSDSNVYVDYSIMLPVLTNSICAVKVWLTKKYHNDRLLTI